MKQKLMVICGGQSSEHIVSRMSCTSVMKNLNKDHYEVTLVGIDKEGIWYELKQGQEDLASDGWLEGAVEIQSIFDLRFQNNSFLISFVLCLKYNSLFLCREGHVLSG